MKRIAVAAAALVLVLAGCSSGDDDDVRSGDASSETEVALEPKLLTPDDFPTGWSINNSLVADVEKPDCFDFDVDTERTGKAKARFRHGTTVPAVDETVSSYGAADEAKGPFATATGALDSCDTFSLELNGRSVEVQVGRMSLPLFGDESAAYQFGLSTEGVNWGAMRWWPGVETSSWRSCTRTGPHRTPTLRPSWPRRPWPSSSRPIRVSLG